ncbi:restriction endonuclease subunit S domain-containing protein [Ralstonia mannitolilytica]|uniref:hypothetical protein n=1 Tax=Ralstonia mannitolilytica TaxID=105219 RepID=UPI00292D7781|nr:hypothetical protein [Ralstonia mannitolilytica]
MSSTSRRASAPQSQHQRLARGSDFNVPTPEGEKPVLEVAKRGSYHVEYLDDPEKCEYFVPVKWLQTVPASQAVREIGFFGNQNTICKPVAAKWRATVDIVITREAPMGEVCQIPPGLRCCLGQRQVLLRPDPAKVDGRFLLYALQSPYPEHVDRHGGIPPRQSNLRSKTA